ncbi:MAG: substrate-binding domain-containing protein [Dermatophilaceae bacterium]|nr:substrate-binding domain-containing protein [Dermatophilaceae bacterium]
MHLTPHRALAVALVSGLAILPLAACNRTSPSTSATGSSAKKITLAVSTLNNPFFVSLKDGAVAEAKAEGVTLNVVDAQNDAATQANQLANAQSQNVQAVIVNPVDSDGAGAPVKALNTAKVPVIAVDRTVNGATVASFIASDNIGGGKQAAAELGKQLGGKGDIIVLQGTAGTSAARDRGRGFTEGMKAFPGIKIVATQTANFDRTQGLDVTTNLVQAHPGVAGIFAQNDEMALGAIKALGAKAGKAVKLCAFDGTADGVAAVKAGTLNCTVAQLPSELGKLAVQQAVKALTGKADANVPVKTTVITAANAATFKG